MATTMKLSMGLLNLISKHGASTINRHTYPGFSESVDIDSAILSHGAARGSEQVTGKGRKIAAKRDLENRRRYMATLNL